MVFPVFLFLVGMSLPIAVNARLRRNPSQWALWTHVFMRSASLVILGLILANGGSADPSAHDHCAATLGVPRRPRRLILYSSIYPGKGDSPWWHKALRMLGAIMVIAMYSLFRRTATTARSTGSTAPTRRSSAIGYAYFAVCLLYIPFRRWLIAPFPG